MFFGEWYHIKEPPGFISILDKCYLKGGQTKKQKCFSESLLKITHQNGFYGRARLSALEFVDLTIWYKTAEGYQWSEEHSILLELKIWSWKHHITATQRIQKTTSTTKDAAIITNRVILSDEFERLPFLYLSFISILLFYLF